MAAPRIPNTRNPGRRTAAALGAAAAALLAAALFLLLFPGPADRRGAEAAAGRAAEYYGTVFGSFAIAAASALGLALAKSAAARTIAWIVAVGSAVVLGYSMEGYLTVKLCLCGSLLLTAALRFSWPRNLLATGAALAAFSAFQRPSALLGETLLVPSQPRIDPASELAFVAVLGTVALAGCLVRALGDRLSEAEEAVAHLDITIDRLSEFNQDLQRYARVADEEAITKERNRISREIHDISGYIFTNLIALMDAAVSMGGRDPGRLAELHAAARAQAKEGLQETRRALRELRASDAHRERGIAAIFKIKHVFERVTGIAVAVEAGNLPPSFGDEIDLAVYRVVQEALTNAMRHGRASRVSIQFWIVDGNLELCVQDDGVGAAEIAKGIGLAGMEERVGRLGGAVRAGNAAEGGFRLTVRIPLPKKE
jgi:signal transduction histidine kinase